MIFISKKEHIELYVRNIIYLVKVNNKMNDLSQWPDNDNKKVIG